MGCSACWKERGEELRNLFLRRTGDQGRRKKLPETKLSYFLNSVIMCILCVLEVDTNSLGKVPLEILRYNIKS